MDNDGPWEDPHHLRKKDKSRVNERLGNDNITKFFVANLPQGYTPWEVSEFVKVFSEDVRDVKDMERALNGTKMGNYKLKVNVVSFSAENMKLFGNLWGRMVILRLTTRMGTKFNIGFPIKLSSAMEEESCSATCSRKERDQRLVRVWCNVLKTR
ncbi:hypothetical protein Hanom_Chr01g00062731 [Helianthus anomalus]